MNYLEAKNVFVSKSSACKKAAEVMFWKPAAEAVLRSTARCG
jgi:hypothetical protein